MRAPDLTLADCNLIRRPAFAVTAVLLPRVPAMLLSVFAAVGLTLGIIGVYGVVPYRVRQQEREFGMRLALGAGPERLAKGVLTQGATYAGEGVLIGIPVAIALARLMSSVCSA